MYRNPRSFIARVMGFWLIHETVKVGFIDFDSENRCVKAQAYNYKAEISQPVFTLMDAA